MPNRAQPQVEDLITQACALLTQMRASGLSPFLDEWPKSSTTREVESKSLPVLQWLSRVHEFAPPFSARFVEAFVAAAPALAWQRSYTLADVSGAFLDSYGWTELMGLIGPIPSQHLACGLLLLGPNLIYPPHRHEAEEIYVPLAGTAAWKRGTKPWHEQPPGTLIHHARHEPHAMRTTTEPLLALYLWHSENLAQKSRLDAEPP
jgi:Dimethlysulfonioproprionate lyase